MSATRVLHVVATTQRRGAEVFAADLVRALDALGVDQRVAVLRRTDGDPPLYEEPVQILDPGSGSRRVGGSRLGQVRALRRLVRSWRPSLIQAHGGETLKVVVASGVGIPIVYRRIGGAPRGLRAGWRRATYRRLLSRPARVVAVAEAVRAESISLLRIPPSRIVTIPNGVDPDRLRLGRAETVRAELNVERSAPLLISVGSVSWEKDPLALVRVGASVLEESPRAVQVLVGDGPMRSLVESRIRSMGLAHRVRVVGGRRDVADLIAAADVLLFASRPDGMEGMPAVLIESGILGTPAAAYDVAGVPEVIVDGTTGRVVPWGDEAALRAATLELLEDADARSAMGRAARDRCLAEFSIGRVAPLHLVVSGVVFVV